MALKGIVHPKMKTFTHPKIVPNLYYTKKDKKKNVHAALSIKLCGSYSDRGGQRTQLFYFNF